VGKKVSAKVGRALDGVAYATLTDEEPPGARITFEAEAEKPTRAASARRVAPETVSGPVEEEEEEEEVAEAEIAAEAAEEPAPAGEQPKKKRTRRGTRGGRGRKKKAPTTAASDAIVADAAKPTPTIHVPPPDLGKAEPEAERVEPEAAPIAEGEAAADGQPKRKRTRRGTRGGRKRRKPAASDNGQPVGDEEATDAEPAEQEEEVAEYVPMSEWIEDFDRRGPGGQTPRV
jgi:ribonuclease E